jgi:hypothetical protein
MAGADQGHWTRRRRGSNGGSRLPLPVGGGIVEAIGAVTFHVHPPQLSRGQPASQKRGTGRALRSFLPTLNRAA